MSTSGVLPGRVVWEGKGANLDVFSSEGWVSQTVQLSS